MLAGTAAYKRGISAKKPYHVDGGDGDDVQALDATAKTSRQLLIVYIVTKER